MATVVYQGSKSCLDNSQLVEARTLKLRLSSPKTHFSQPFELATKANNTIKEQLLHDQNPSSNRDYSGGGSSFFHALYNHSQAPKEVTNKEMVYVHPLVKRSSSRLSDKSLEMCTESLGSETGSYVSGDISLFLSSSSSSSSSSFSSLCFKEDESVVISSDILLSTSVSRKKSCQLSSSKKAHSRAFPPPLTTMSGSGSLHVRPHRKDRRLVIEAIKSPSSRPCFLAERLNGRLRLSLVEESPVSSSGSGETPENIPESIVNETEETQNDHIDHDRDEADDMKSQVEDGNGGCFDKAEEMEMEMCDVDVEAGMDFEDFRRPRRCIEENKRLINWEPFWVATS